MVSRQGGSDNQRRPKDVADRAHLPIQGNPQGYERRMGAIHVDVTIRNPADASRCWHGLFLVDTGATDCVVPRQHLEAIGVKPGGQRAYALADGCQARMDVAVAQIEFLDEFVGGTVVFGEARAEPLLGVTALASMGVEVDPRNQKLRKLSPVRLKRARSQILPTFSQAHGYEAMPTMLKLEELDQKARVRIGNVFLAHIAACQRRHSKLVSGYMAEISRDLHRHHHVLSLDDWSRHINDVKARFIKTITVSSFNHVFDMIEFVLRHPQCPRPFIQDMKMAFSNSRLAYAIDDTDLPTIVPTATAEEGEAILSSLRDLTDAGLSGSAAHLRKSSECINRREWANSIRESIHAVESVALKVDPTANGLKVAVQSMERRMSFHPALKKAILSLYGYTSDEKGIRHALLDEDEADVDGDDAVFMLGACASFASYLWRKYSAKLT